MARWLVGWAVGWLGGWVGEWVEHGCVWVGGVGVRGGGEDTTAADHQLCWTVYFIAKALAL